MDLSTRERGTHLRWGAILAGALITVATAWAGDLLGSLLALVEPGESSAWAWIGAIVGLGMVVLGALAGGWVASRAAGATDRTSGLFHGLAVWGLFGTVSAALFAILGGNLALVAGATAGAVRLAIGFALLGLLGALLGATAGGTLAVRRGEARPGRRGGRGHLETTRSSARIETPEPARSEGPEVYTRPADRGDVPPSVH